MIKRTRRYRDCQRLMFARVAGVIGNGLLRDARNKGGVEIAVTEAAEMLIAIELDPVFEDPNESPSKAEDIARVLAATSAATESNGTSEGEADAAGVEETVAAGEKHGGAGGRALPSACSNAVDERALREGGSEL